MYLKSPVLLAAEERTSQDGRLASLYNGASKDFVLKAFREYNGLPAMPQAFRVMLKELAKYPDDPKVCELVGNHIATKIQQGAMDMALAVHQFIAKRVTSDSLMGKNMALVAETLSSADMVSHDLRYECLYQ